jgi:MFS family permease
VKRTIRLYIAFQFFFSLLLWLPIFYEYQKRMGLSETEIFGIQSLYYIAFCLLEIPTGMLADRLGYLLCMRLGAAALVVANVLPVAWPTYSGFLVHFMLIALSRSFISGASSAYLYEYLSSQGRGGEYRKVEGNARAYGLIGKIVCWSAMGPLLNSSHSWVVSLPYTLSALSGALSLGFAVGLPVLAQAGFQSTAPGVAGSRGASFLRGLAGSFAVIRAVPAIGLIMIQGVAVFVLARICQINLFQPILESKHVPVGSYGVVLSVMTAFEAIGSARPDWFTRNISDLNAVFMLSALMAGALALIPWVGIPGALACLCVFSLAVGFSFPIQKQLLNDAIPASRSQYRATLMSLESLMDRAICAWVATQVGAFMAQGRLASFLVLSSSITFAAVLLLLATIRVTKELHRFTQSL